MVHRFAPRPEDVVCSYDVLWNLSPRDWDVQMDEWSAMSGELWFFDNQIVWQEHASRAGASLPPEVWTAQHGLYLVDGYMPDDEGRVVSGGPY